MELRHERFDALWREHHLAITRFVVRRLPAHEDPSDVVSDVFVTAWRRLDELPTDPGQARPWLYGVAHKMLANRLRGLRRRTALETRLCLEREPSTSEGPEGTRLEEVPDVAALVEAFNSLSVADREAVALVTWEELTPREAARVVGVSPPRFRTRLHRARQRLLNRASKSGAASNAHGVSKKLAVSNTVKEVQ